MRGGDGSKKSAWCKPEKRQPFGSAQGKQAAALPEYKYTHHSAADALEAVKPEVLAQNATLMALTAYWIADRPERFASPWPAEKTAKMLRAQHQDEMLKAFGLWPKELAEVEKKEEAPN